MTGMLELVEDELFYFDAPAADRTVRFIETFCKHYEGQFAGQPFLLAPPQKKIVRDLFGWKWRSTGYRRFTDVYFEAAVGAGKSPLLAAIGLFGLIADGEAGAQIYALASSYSQARIVFESAKKFVLANDELEKRLIVVDREIRHPRSGSFWRISSGKGPGAGCRPSMVLGDECHEWKGPGAYHPLKDRMAKRRQPLMFIATNAGDSRACFCWQLREKAVAALAGKGDISLYPIIWAAPEDAECDDPDAWKMANPLIGVTIAEEKVARNCAEAMKDDVELARFKRLYLGIWPKIGAGRWLDLGLWDEAEAMWDEEADHPIDFEALKLLPLYVGFDLSQCDDLCAVDYYWIAPDRVIIDSHFWLPNVTGIFYRDKHAIPYIEWAEKGYITLTKEPTISPAVRKAIAASIIAKGKEQKQPIKAVCYDRYKADETVATLEAAGITCVPIAQGYSVSPGCHEVERRLKEHSMIIIPNPVLRFCAENCQVKSDDRGNIWPVKPNAKGKYAGERCKKIDGISALVTVATEARKFIFPKASNTWQGTISRVSPPRPAIPSASST